MGKNDRTVYRRSSDNQWVEKSNNKSRGNVFETQADAIESAKRKIENAGGGELVIKGRDGLIRNKDTVPPGNDPNPPKDTEH